MQIFNKRNISLLFILLFAFTCKTEINFPEGIVYLNGSLEAIKNFKNLDLDPKQIAYEKLLTRVIRLKQGVDQKDGSAFVAVTSYMLVDYIANERKLTTFAVLEGWRDSFKTGKAWCDYELLLRDPIVSYEILPVSAYGAKILADGRLDKIMQYRVSLRKKGQTSELDQDNSLTLIFQGTALKNGDFLDFSIISFVNHCPLY